MDGIAGLVTEPIDGYKNEVSTIKVAACTQRRTVVQGTIGALKGTGRGREYSTAWFFAALMVRRSPSPQCRFPPCGWLSRARH